MTKILRVPLRLRTYFWLIAMAFALSGCGTPAPTPTPSSVVGRWVGGFNPIAVSKPTLPAGTVHHITLNADGTCHFEGFVELVPLTSGNVRVYSGDGQWRLEQQKDGKWNVIVTQTRGEYRHEDKLQMVWTGKAWE